MGMIYETRSIALKGSVIGFQCILRLKNKMHSCLTCTKLNNSTWWKHCRWPEQWKQPQLSFFFLLLLPLLASLGTICTDKFCLCFCRLKLKLSQLGEHCSSANTTRWQHDFKVTLDTQIFKRLQAGTAPPLPRHHNLFVTYSPRLKILISNNKK